MAPRSSQQRRTIGPQSEHIYELGVAGRKTGITLKDSGIRDEHGMEPLDALFSSPSKSEANGDIHDDGHESEEEDDGTGEAMDITTTSGIGPAALLNGHGNRLSFPLPRSHSPVKTSLNSPAQRNRFLARKSPPGSGRINSSQPLPKRRLDFDEEEGNDTRASSQPLYKKGMPTLTANGLTNGHRFQSAEEESDEDQPDEQREDEEVDAFVEESMAMLTAETEASPEPEQEENVDNESSEEEPVARVAASKRKPAPGPKPKTNGVGARGPKATKKSKVVQEESDGSDQEQGNGDEQEPEPVESEAEEAPMPPKKKAGRPKASSAVSESRPKKRRSLNDETEASDSGAAARQTKRQRTEETAAPAVKSRGRPKKTSDGAAQSKSPETASKPAPAEKGKKGRKRKSSPVPGDVSQVIVPRGPPLPKARGLLISRREIPGESSSNMLRTRSGRNSFKPIAYWRNERVDYEQEETESAPTGKKNSHKKIVLPSIKEVVRVDEPEPSTVRRSHYKRGKSSRRGRGARSYNDSDDEDIPVEPWESNPGTIAGQVVCWHPDHEFNPPAQDELVDVEPKQLAISAAAVATQEVKDATFRYAKTLSEGFFNVGVVDLPPGSEKRPKNSRKMFMTFFVHTGRVLVTVNETSFRISKGSMWFVPRGNYYSIENDYDQPARIFFSQGCEVAPRPVEEDEEEEQELPEEDEEPEEGEEEEEE
ncbi:centromere protein 3 [Echria macrotheca]|uniref:CENP-C homolog n=1 Tax=Echria macrotheca TaxID=438768 RepID=A0AAJ0BND9_9PEZI|nr:centromere protein 3 [Echria macrotheca]